MKKLICLLLAYSVLFAGCAGREANTVQVRQLGDCLLYTSPSPRDATLSRMPSSA